ncbi:UNVERIFIED_CONTAM: hypothetical protein Sradi_5631900 [Sesamum radiatum]|uniref:Pentatricopeptide repeat-containing protein n=1 Tax=Sesamum radiatum TaxID=300843 RepID=A0AAW2L2X6_SESRA
MYNVMIGLLTSANDIDNAFRLLDDMVFHGAFPDSLTYNMIFECLIKNKKVREVGKFFIEMVKNEWPPTPANFTAAIKMLFDGDDPEMAIEIWKYMAKNNISPRDDGVKRLESFAGREMKVGRGQGCDEFRRLRSVNLHQSAGYGESMFSAGVAFHPSIFFRFLFSI